jgi:hypothetical protein
MFNRLRHLTLLALVLFTCISCIAIESLKKEKIQNEGQKTTLESKTGSGITAELQMKTELQLQAEKKVILY